MAMLRAGAYSKKFQSLEKERARQAKEQEKANQGKAQLYSKQTALRQKALEEKKRAMVIAEEDRRKKALEERRVAQKEATQRFRSVLGRIRSSTKSQRPHAKRNDQPPFEFYLPDKPKPKGAPAQPKKSVKDSRVKPGERVALGKDVEIKFNPVNGYHPSRQVNGLQRRTPSLDDVLGQIKGEKTVTHNNQEPSVSHGRVVVHRMVPDMFPPQGQTYVHTMGRRSSSDPSLNCKKVFHLDGTVSTYTTAATDLGDASQAMSDLCTRNVSDESVAFQTTRNSRCSSRVDDDLRVTSPDTPLSLSNESLSNTTEDEPPPFTNLHDSLDDAKQHAVFIIEGDEDSWTVGDLGPPAKSRSNKVSQSNAMSVPQAPLPSGHQQQPVYACERDNIFSTDSLEEQQYYPDKLADSRSSDVQSVSVLVPISRIAEKLREAELMEEAKKKPKVVGILKKSSSIASVTNSESGSGKAKRVRFADRIETSSAELSTHNTSSNHSSVDQRRIELWKKVLPNGVTTHYTTNSAFTPKMRVSLSSKPSLPSQPAPTHHPLNGLTVHIPVPSADTSPSLSQEQSNSATIRKSGPPREDSPIRPKMSAISVSLNGVRPSAPAGDNASQENPLSAGSASRDDPPTHISLEKTPTDDDITKLWDQIRNAFDDNQQKVLIPPQVFNFKIEPGGQSRQSSEISSAGYATNQTLTVTYDQRGHHSMPQNARKVTSAERFYSKPTETSSQKGSTHRQTNLSRPIRYQSNLSAPPAQLLARRGHSHTATYPITNRQVNGTQPTVQMTSTEPDLSRMNGRKAHTALSMEEKRLMMSIDNLNQKIRDHMARRPTAQKFQTPISPEPPDFTPEFYPHPPSSPVPPQMHRVTSTHSHTHSNGHPPRARNIRRNSKAATLAVAANSQASDPPQTHNKSHRPMFYNT